MQVLTRCGLIAPNERAEFGMPHPEDFEQEHCRGIFGREMRGQVRQSSFNLLVLFG